MAAVDLEGYSFEPGNKNICRATEGTVLSRIPPRVRIRANSPLELPHIMILIDDPEGLTIEKAFDMAAAEGLKPLYDTDLMLGSGHITGTFIPDGSAIAESIIKGLSALKSANSDGLLFLVGDGNHSLASAKAHWENIREGLSEEERKTHPARYALAEIVNIHDKGLDFEPIHRVVFNISAEEFITKAAEYFKDNGIIIDSSSDDKQSFTVVAEGTKDVKISLAEPPHTLAVGSVQMMIDSLGLECDYIHGEDSVRKLASSGNTGILVPGISKDTFFGTVEKEGVFPRKTFSMGEAFEKRFYLEAKKIE
jgi:catechol 2,3-dioxygenase-like lactoylglutathione lyase family enzyme